MAFVIRPKNEVRAAIMRGLPDYKDALDGAWLGKAVPLTNGMMYVDDEFPLKDPRPSDANWIATRLVLTVGLIELDTCIYGPAVVVGPPDRDGNDTDIPDKLQGFIHLLQAGLKKRVRRK